MDIVERLRSRMTLYDTIYREAADEIERLRAERQQLMNEFQIEGDETPLDVVRRLAAVAVKLRGMPQRDNPRDLVGEELRSERDSWRETAALGFRNTNYYCGLLERIGAALGPEAFTDDAGGLHDSPLCAKIPELVERRLGSASALASPLKEEFERAAATIERWPDWKKEMLRRAQAVDGMPSTNNAQCGRCGHRKHPSNDCNEGTVGGICCCDMTVETVKDETKTCPNCEGAAYFEHPDGDGEHPCGLCGGVGTVSTNKDGGR